MIYMNKFITKSIPSFLIYHIQPKYSETDKQMDNEMTNDIDKLKVSEDMYQRIQRKVKSTRLQTTKTEKEMTLDERLLEQK